MNEKLILWGHTGKTLGYPPCCIEFFINRGALIMQNANPGKYSLDENQMNITKLGMGFIPCPICAAKVANGVALESLIVDRDPTLPPFPNA